MLFVFSQAGERFEPLSEVILRFAEKRNTGALKICYARGGGYCSPARMVDMHFTQSRRGNKKKRP